jgi:3-oxoacyl-[acyl-carrier protein] reductase
VTGVQTCALPISTDDDIAHACLFLASDVSRQITGIDLPVDGGWAAL